MNTATQKRSALVLLGAAVFGIAGLELLRSGTRYDVPELDLPRAQERVAAGALVIDVRGKDAFDHRHIPGAVTMPLSVLRAAIPASIAQANERPVVVYCNDGVTTGPEATHLLREAGFRNVANIKAGIEGWARAGYPVAKGT